jgi:hypothetical protein
VEQGFGVFTVACKGETYAFKSGAPVNPGISDALIDIPGDTITYRKCLGEFTVSGKKGTVLYKNDVNDYTVTGPAGKTVYTKLLTGGYTLEGVPLEKHPYRYWGLEFFLSDYNIGIVIEFNKLVTFPELPRLLEFKRALVVGDRLSH